MVAKRGDSALELPATPKKHTAAQLYPSDPWAALRGVQGTASSEAEDPTVVTGGS